MKQRRDSACPRTARRRSERIIRLEDAQLDQAVRSAVRIAQRDPKLAPPAAVAPAPRAGKAFEEVRFAEPDDVRMGGQQRPQQGRAGSGASDNEDADGLAAAD